MTLVFRFPMPPNLLNPKRAGHWRVVAARKKQWMAQCDALQQIGVLPAPPKTPYGKVVLSAVMRLGHAMDDENAFARASKFPCDWLKTRGYIRDDRKQVVRWAGLPEQIVGRKQDYTVELTLTEEAA